MKRKYIILPVLAALTLPLASCLKGESDDYDAWRERNDAYLAAIDTREYEKIVPDWAPENAVYIKWHNDRSLTADNLVPMSTSTVDMKYELEDIDGNKIQNSYSVVTGDSVYQSQPKNNIIGMWIAMTTMHVGDSVTMIIPYGSGYGAQLSNGILPYSNLIYHVKLKAIKAFEKPNT
jgi:hypothetical protein